MFIDELAAEFLDFKKNVRPNFVRLKQRQRKMLSQLNHEVHIRDLVVRAIPPTHFGESEAHTNTYPQSTEKRLRAYISSLFELANEDHRANYCERRVKGHYALKKGKENHVTRLLTTEFSLYTKKPLTAEEFRALYRDIDKMGELLEQNVHILLSSFAVQDVDGKILNMSLFVEGGLPPIIHSFAKNTASTIDIDYTKPEQLYSQQTRGKRPTFHADLITGKDGVTISNGSVFEVRTKGGACYTQAVDVCLDHAQEHSKHLQERRILDDSDPDELLPEQVEQCITSNSIYPRRESQIADVITHADPAISMCDKYHRKMGGKKLTEEAQHRIVPKKFNRMQIKTSPTGYEIKNPSFGSDCVVEVFAERPAAKYIPQLREAVSKHNKNVCSRQLVTARQHKFNENDVLIEKINNSQFITQRVGQLKEQMLKKCRPSFWQALFNTEECKQKCAAKKVIDQSFNFIDSVIQEHGAESVFFIRGWKNDLAFRLLRIATPSNSSPLINALKNNIKQVIDDKLQKDLGCEFEDNVRNNTL